MNSNNQELEKGKTHIIVEAKERFKMISTVIKSGYEEVSMDGIS